MSLNATIMFFVPLRLIVIAKNALLIAERVFTLWAHLFATEAWHVIVLKTHMFEVPFYLVGVFKYIADVFEVCCNHLLSLLPLFKKAALII